MSEARATHGIEPSRRTVDILVSGVALLLLSPVFALIGLAIRFTNRGPIFFSQARVGEGGVPFRIVKFRTMVRGAERLGPKISGAGDTRVTRVGRFLRSTKVDELPQLWNVLKGEMTLVGPRAEVPEMVCHYTAEERQLLEARPGVTGPGQIFFTTNQAWALDGVEDVEGHYVTHQLHPKLAIDLEYLKGRNWRTDSIVLARSVLLMLRTAFSASSSRQVTEVKAASETSRSARPRTRL